MNIKRQGKRHERRKNLKEAKVHGKSVSEIFKSLDAINNVLRLNKVVLTENNIVNEVGKVSDIKLGAMEKMILLNTQKEYEKNNN